MDLLSQFEHDGFCVVSDALSPDLLERLRADFATGLATVPPAVPNLKDDAEPGHTKEDYLNAGGVPPVVHSMAGAGPHGVASRRYPYIIHWASSFLELVDNERVRPLLAAALGDDFVLDHDYGHALRPFELVGSGEALLPVTRGTLHNVDHVPSPVGGSDRLWAGTSNLVTVVYDLLDAAPEDGGFGCLPQSHVQGYEMPIPREPHPCDYFSSYESHSYRRSILIMRRPLSYGQDRRVPCVSCSRAMLRRFVRSVHRNLEPLLTTMDRQVSVPFR